MSATTPEALSTSASEQHLREIRVHLARMAALLESIDDRLHRITDAPERR